MSDAIGAYGVIVRRNGTAISEIAEVTPPQPEKDAIETTAHDGPNKYRQYIPGLKAPGEMSLVLNWIPADTSHIALLAAFESDDIDLFQVEFPDADGTIMQVSGFVRTFQPQAPIDDRLQINCAIHLTSKVDFL